MNIKKIRSLNSLGLTLSNTKKIRSLNSLGLTLSNTKKCKVDIRV